MSEISEKKTSQSPHAQPAANRGAGGSGGSGRAPKPIDPVKEKKNTIHTLVGLFIAFILPLFLPEISSITRMGWQMLFTFLGCIYILCTTSEFMVCTLIGMTSMVVTGYKSVADMLAATIGSTTLMQVILMFIVIHLAIKSGAAENIGKWIITRKLFHGRAMLMTSAFLLMPVLIGIVAGQTPNMLICLPIIYFALESAGVDANSKYAHILFLTIFGMARGAALTIDSKPFAKIYLSSLIPAMENTNSPFNAGLFAVMSTMILVIVALLMPFVMKLMGCSQDMSALRTNNFVSDENMKPHFNLLQISSILVMLICCFWSNLWALVPEGLPGYNTINSLGAVMIIAPILLILYLIPTKDGSRVINLSEATSKAVMWPVVLMVGVFIALGAALTDAQCGITSAIAGSLSGVTASLGFPVFSLIAFVIMYLLSLPFGFVNGGIIMGSLLASFVPMLAEQQINITVFIAGLGVIRGFGALGYASTPLGYILTPRGVETTFVIKKSYSWISQAAIVLIMWILTTAFAYIL